MNAKQGARSYVDFEPTSEWSRGEESDILRVHLPGIFFFFFFYKILKTSIWWIKGTKLHMNYAPM